MHFQYFRIINIKFCKKNEQNNNMGDKFSDYLAFLPRIVLITCCSHNKLSDAMLGDKFYNSFLNAIHFNV